MMYGETPVNEGAFFHEGAFFLDGGQHASGAMSARNAPVDRRRSMDAFRSPAVPAAIPEGEQVVQKTPPEEVLAVLAANSREHRENMFAAGFQNGAEAERNSEVQQASAHYARINAFNNLETRGAMTPQPGFAHTPMRSSFLVDERFNGTHGGKLYQHMAAVNIAGQHGTRGMRASASGAVNIQPTYGVDLDAESPVHSAHMMKHQHQFPGAQRAGHAGAIAGRVSAPPGLVAPYHRHPSGARTSTNAMAVAGARTSTSALAGAGARFSAFAPIHEEGTPTVNDEPTRHVANGHHRAASSEVNSSLESIVPSGGVTYKLSGGPTARHQMDTTMDTTMDTITNKRPDSAMSQQSRNAAQAKASKGSGPPLMLDEKLLLVQPSPVRNSHGHGKMDGIMEDGVLVSPVAEASPAESSEGGTPPFAAAA